MPFRSVIETSYEAYLDYLYPETRDGADKSRAVAIQEREERLAAFPHSVVLQVAYPELDFANRWCWQQFGTPNGECYQEGSEYPVCNLPNPHSHEGRWLTHWLAKTNYDFGYNEWCFAQQADQEKFLEFVPHIDWGELY